jgi:hypothetical protein
MPGETTVNEVPMQVTNPLRWIARVWSAISVLFLAAFLVEHFEWFTVPGQWPPANVTVAVCFHALIIVGLLLAWRWERSGGLLAILAAIGFFLAAGGRAEMALVVALLAAPGLLFMIVGWNAVRGRG